MPLGTTLLELTDMLRSEIGAAPNVAQNVSSVPYWQQLLRRNQRTLYARRKWGHLWVQRDIPILANERYYTLPSDLPATEITQAWVQYQPDSAWQPILYGISPSQLNYSNADIGATAQPISRWARYEGGQIEIWPLPSDNLQTVRFYGYKSLAPLVDNTDRADIDDDLIVMFAAAAILKEDDKKLMLQAAEAHYNSLKANDSIQNTIILGGPIPPANAMSRFDRWQNDPIRVAKV